MQAPPHTIAHGRPGAEKDFPPAHSHKLVTQLTKLIDGRPDLVPFESTFAPDAVYAEPVGGAGGPSGARGPAAIAKAFHARAAAITPAIADGGLPSDATSLLSVQPQSGDTCLVLCDKAYRCCCQVRRAGLSDATLTRGRLLRAPPPLLQPGAKSGGSDHVLHMSWRLTVDRDGLITRLEERWPQELPQNPLGIAIAQARRAAGLPVGAAFDSPAAPQKRQQAGTPSDGSAPVFDQFSF